jgi:Family of unknown function (DUF5690)
MANISPARTALYLSIAAFGAYFSMYAFRKPFAAATYSGLHWYGLDYKAILVISQLFGYLLSKFIGIILISELAAKSRIPFLIGLLSAAFLSLIGFALVPLEYKFLMLFCNGIPLGMVFGVVFSFLEGRRFTEFMSLGLGTSIIFASGAVKSVGLILLNQHHVSQWWMPALAGLLFTPMLIASIWALKQLPPPSPEDIALRSERLPMTKSARKAFFAKYALPILLFVAIYITLTAFRDIRDNFSVEIWSALGFNGRPDLLASTELYISISILLAIGALSFIQKNSTAFFCTQFAILAGGLLLGLSTFAYQKQLIAGQLWMIISGFGLFLSYTVYQGILFDRMIATVRATANVGFLMYIADAFGYLGSAGVILYKYFGTAQIPWIQYYTKAAYISSILTVGLSLFVMIHFYRRLQKQGYVKVIQ